MKMILRLLLNGVTVFVAAYLLQGVQIDNFLTALLVSIVLGILNMILKPILVILTLPINVITLGLFTLVINTLMVVLTQMVVPGFEVVSFWWALLFSVVLSLISWFLSSIE